MQFVAPRHRALFLRTSWRDRTYTKNDVAPLIVYCGASVYRVAVIQLRLQTRSLDILLSVCPDIFYYSVVLDFLH